MGTPKDTERVWHYYVDAEGILWHDRVPFEDPILLHFFMKNLERLPDGKLRVLCQGETCYLTCEDVPYVILNIENVGALNLTPLLVFPGKYTETLNPLTLFVGDKNVLYCKVRGGEFVARFSRGAYREFIKKVQYDKKKNEYYLTIDKKRCVIKGVKS